MRKLGFSGMKSLDQLKSQAGSLSGMARNSFPSRTPSDSITIGGFANLKLTAEKLVKEQASVKTDLEMANVKLRKSMESIHALEEKLQNSANENAKLKVKQKEDEKLWKGMESKLSSTKTLCDQLTETLQLLASQVQDGEKDKELIEGKLVASSDTVDCLHRQMHDLSLKLGASEETIRIREKELEKLSIEKDEMDKLYGQEKCRTTNLIEQKDAMIRKFEETIVENNLAAESLNSKLEEVHLELRSKEDEVKCLIAAQSKLETEKSDIQLSANKLSEKLFRSTQEIEKLEAFIHISATQLVELDKQNMIITDKFDQLNAIYEACFQLYQQERDLTVKHARTLFDQLQDKFFIVISEKDMLASANGELNEQILELEQAKESLTTQISNEGYLARDRIQKLESEAESLLSMKMESEVLVSKLKDDIETLTQNSRASENKMQDLLSKLSALEMESKDKTDKLVADMQEKNENMNTLQKETEQHQSRVDSLEKEVSHLQNILNERQQLIQQCKANETKLELQIRENQASLAASENKLTEAKKQYDLMLENKQFELSKHLKELSQRNDQAINEIRRKYEEEKQEIVTAEKGKVERIVEEMERKCESTVAQCKEDSKQQLMRIQEEHAALVRRVQLDHEKKEFSLKVGHDEELRHAQVQAQTELIEKTMSLKNEHEIQLKALRCQYEDECVKLQEELDLQMSKEERQRALLQMQWRVMSDKPEEEQEVNSKKERSISTRKFRVSASANKKRSQHSLVRADDDEEVSPFVEVTHPPVPGLLKKVGIVNTGNVVNLPKNQKKVTHRYEVEANNERTLRKRRKTDSTLMFEDSWKPNKKSAPKSKTPISAVKKKTQADASNIGDLFAEGSLNPYADDPYAFDRST